MTIRKPLTEDQKEKARERVRRHRAKTLHVAQSEDTASDLTAFESEETVDKFEALKSIGLFFALSLSAFLLFLQILPLYEASSWQNEKLAAAGSLLVVLVFASYFSCRRNITSFLLCFLGLSYEISFVYYASEISENKIVSKNYETLSLSDEKLHDTKRDKLLSLETYEAQSKRFRNPEDKMFQNTWYFKTYVTPSQLRKETSETLYYKRQSELLSQASTGNNTVTLKILYRITLILCSMLLVHLFLEQTKDFFLKNKDALRNLTLKEA